MENRDDLKSTYIGECDEPNNFNNRSGIKPPPIGSNNFEIKASLIRMVQGNKFHGLPMEDPLEHIDLFDMLCSTVNTKGVSEDAYKLRLFPFSLSDKAHYWQKNLPAGTITTWEECKRQFLKKFFSTARTVKLRKDISSFTQQKMESFGEAWERLKSYTLQCPHHGFSEETLLATLYRGCLPTFKMLLDTASQGNFLGQVAEQGLQLVENLARSNKSYEKEYEETRPEIDEEIRHNNKEMQSLNEKLDKLLKATTTLQRPTAVTEEEGSYNEQFKEMNHIGRCDRYSNDDTRNVLAQLLENQSKNAEELNARMNDINNKMDTMYEELQYKVDKLESQVKDTE